MIIPTRLVLTELLNRRISELVSGRGGKKAAGNATIPFRTIC